MPDEKVSRLSDIEHRLADLRAEETRRYWHFTRWLVYSILLGLVNAIVVVAIRHTAAAPYVLAVGLTLAFVAFGRAVWLAGVWWPLGTEKSRLLRERFRLKRSLGMRTP
ncbi:MAG: hypothetical protein ACYCYK_07605 [Candidatus Dormibacteria bacterium]